MNVSVCHNIDVTSNNELDVVGFVPNLLLFYWGFKYFIINSTFLNFQSSVSQKIHRVETSKLSVGHYIYYKFVWGFFQFTVINRSSIALFKIFQIFL